MSRLGSRRLQRLLLWDDVFFKRICSQWCVANQPPNRAPHAKNSVVCMVKLEADPSCEPITKTYLTTPIKSIGSDDEASLVNKIYDVCTNKQKPHFEIGTWQVSTETLKEQRQRLEELKLELKEIKKLELKEIKKLELKEIKDLKETLRVFKMMRLQKLIKSLEEEILSVTEPRLKQLRLRLKELKEVKEPRLKELLTKAAYMGTKIYDEQSTCQAAGLFSSSSSIYNNNLSRQATASSLYRSPFPPLLLRDHATGSIRPRWPSISRDFSTSALLDHSPNLCTKENTSLAKRMEKLEGHPTRNDIIKVVGSEEEVWNRSSEDYAFGAHVHEDAAIKIKKLPGVRYVHPDSSGPPPPPPESDSSPPPPPHESNSSSAPPGRKPTLKKAAIVYLAYCTPFVAMHLILNHFLWGDI